MLSAHPDASDLCDLSFSSASNVAITSSPSTVPASTAQRHRSRIRVCHNPCIVCMRSPNFQCPPSNTSYRRQGQGCRYQRLAQVSFDLALPNHHVSSLHRHHVYFRHNTIGLSYASITSVGCLSLPIIPCSNEANLLRSSTISFASGSERNELTFVENWKGEHECADIITLFELHNKRGFVDSMVLEPCHKQYSMPNTTFNKIASR